MRIQTTVSTNIACFNLACMKIDPVAQEEVHKPINVNDPNTRSSKNNFYYGDGHQPRAMQRQEPHPSKLPSKVTPDTSAKKKITPHL